MAFVQFPPPKEVKTKWPVIFALGFRPFFFLAGLSAVVLVGLWLAVLSGKSIKLGYYDVITWHAHEMIFGYAVAVVAGFLLTAAKNWTGIQTARYGELAVLVGLWFLGRLMPFIGVGGWFAASFDLVFLAMLTISLASPLIKAKKYNNLIFIPMLAGLFGANFLVHLKVAGVSIPFGVDGLTLGLDLIVVLMTIMGGRVIPFFIERGVGGDINLSKNSWLEWATIISMIGYVISHQFFATSPIFFSLALIAGLIQLLRWSRWHCKGVWSVPIVWVLFLAYGWIPLGLIFHALVALEVLTSVSAIHSFGVGAIGMLTLGMMARVSLGHTGRTVGSNRLMIYSFMLIFLSVVARIFGPLVTSNENYLVAINIAGNLWIAAFVLFLIRYSPMLWKPRIDGMPG